MSDSRQPPRAAGNVVPLHDTKTANIDLKRSELEALLIQLSRVTQAVGLPEGDALISAMGKLRNALKGL